MNLAYDCRAGTRRLLLLGAEYPSPKKVNLSIMVGLYKPKKFTCSATKCMFGIPTCMVSHLLRALRCTPGFQVSGGGHAELWGFSDDRFFNRFCLGQKRVTKGFW